MVRVKLTEASHTSFVDSVRAVRDYGIALVIDKLDCEVVFQCRLVRVGRRAGDLVQTETPEQLRFLRHLVIDPYTELVGHVVTFEDVA